MIHRLFQWGIGIAIGFTLLYGIGGESFLQLLTNEQAVIEAAQSYRYWAILIPLAGYMAFLLDGIFIGATATKLMLQSMLVAAIAFFLTYFTLKSSLGNHALWLAFMIYLSLRGIVQRILGRKILR